MGYTSELVEFERELSILEPLSIEYSKYFDLDKLESEIDALARRIAESNINKRDKMMFLDRIGDYVDTINDYKNSPDKIARKNTDNPTKEKFNLENLGPLFLYYVAGVLTGKAGIDALDFYRTAEEGREEKIVDYVFNKLVEEVLGREDDGGGTADEKSEN